MRGQGRRGLGPSPSRAPSPPAPPRLAELVAARPSASRPAPGPGPGRRAPPAPVHSWSVGAQPLSSSFGRKPPTRLLPASTPDYPLRCRPQLPRPCSDPQNLSNDPYSTFALPLPLSPTPTSTTPSSSRTPPTQNTETRRRDFSCTEFTINPPASFAATPLRASALALRVRPPHPFRSPPCRPHANSPSPRSG